MLDNSNIVEIYSGGVFNTIPIHTLNIYNADNVNITCKGKWLRVSIRSQQDYLDDLETLKKQPHCTIISGILIVDCAGCKYATRIFQDPYNIITLDCDAGIMSIYQPLFYVDDRDGSPLKPSTPLTTYYLLPVEDFDYVQCDYYDVAKLKKSSSFDYKVCNISDPYLFDRMLNKHPDTFDEFLELITIYNSPRPEIYTYKVNSAKVHPVFMDDQEYKKRIEQWRDRNCIYGRHGSRTKAAAHTNV